MPSGQPHQRQHLVSKVLLQQFADPHLEVMDVTTGKVFKSSPKREGWQKDYIVHEAGMAEARWLGIETRVPPVLNALAAQEPLDAAVVEPLKDLFALHWARGSVLKVVHDELIGPYLREHPEILVDITDKDFFDRYGLYPAGPEALKVMRREILSRALQLHDEDAFFAQRVHENFDLMRANLDKMRMDVGLAEEGEFLISDRPATTKRHGHDGVGPLQGVPWLQADAACMPLAPGLLIAPADGPGGYADVPLEGVRELNRLQVMTAERHVYMRPGSGLFEAADHVRRTRPNVRELADCLLQRYLADHGY